MEIDEVNYAILKLTAESEGPIWKNKIHQRLSEKCEELPDVDSVSVQTVGRRVDWLRDNGYLDSCIVSPDEIKRDLIIAFKTTEQGREALETKEDEFLQDAVQHAIFSNESAPDKPVLAELICTHLDLDQNVKETLIDQYSTPELETFLTLYYLREQVSDVFSADAERFEELMENSDAIDSSLYHGIDEQFLT